MLDSPESAKRVIASLQDANATLFNKRTLVFFHTPLTKDDLKKNAVVDFPEALVATTGAIPGLFIFENFVTDEEAAELVRRFDEGAWEKLLNRRVQHFGFEFKYGTNDVDPNQTISSFPAYLDSLSARKRFQPI